MRMYGLRILLSLWSTREKSSAVLFALQGQSFKPLVKGEGSTCGSAQAQARRAVHMWFRQEVQEVLHVMYILREVRM